MYPGLLDEIKAQKLITSSLYNVIIDSTVVHLSKPDPKIYQLATKLAAVEPDEILFVDNLQMNLDVANNVGWQTLLYDPADTVKSNQQLKTLLI
jgi:HAD superfamily hydrolase (TIGR01509 family)